MKRVSFPVVLLVAVLTSSAAAAAALKSARPCLDCGVVFNVRPVLWHGQPAPAARHAGVLPVSAQLARAPHLYEIRVHMDAGETLIVRQEGAHLFKSGDRVRVHDGRVSEY